MKKYKYFVLIGIGIILLSCSDRKHINPLDPKNSTTKGRITGVYIFSRERQVTVQWQPLALEGLDAINVYRQVGAEGPFELYQKLKAGTSSFIDNDVVYGKKFAYYVTASAGDYESPPSKTVMITPGPTYTWVADGETGYFTRLSHDLQTELFRFGVLRFPYRLAVSPKERSAWGYSRFSDVIYKLNEFGDVDVRLRNYTAVTDMAVDTTFNDLWITQSNLGVISRLDENGNMRVSVKQVKKPTAITVEFRHHACWVIDNSSKFLFKVSRYGTIGVRSSESFISPQDLTYSASQEALWIADSSRVVQFNLFGRPTGVQLSGLFNATLIDHDEVRETTWVVDLMPHGEPARLLKIDARGAVIFQLDKFAFPQSIDVNEFDGSCLVGDPGNGRLWRVSEDGSQIDPVGNFIAPYAVAVEHHGF